MLCQLPQLTGKHRFVLYGDFDVENFSRKEKQHYNKKQVQSVMELHITT